MFASIPKRSKGTRCRRVGFGLRWFESSSAHKNENTALAAVVFVLWHKGSAGHAEGGIRKEIRGPIQQNGVNFQGREEKNASSADPGFF